MQNFIFAVALMLCGSTVSAVEMPQLAKNRNCTLCHALERKIVGPSWSDIAKHYKGNHDAPIFLANKIKMGGFGVWGAMPMPEQLVSNAEAKELAKFILGLSGDKKMVASGR